MRIFKLLFAFLLPQSNQISLHLKKNKIISNIKKCDVIFFLVKNKVVIDLFIISYYIVVRNKYYFLCASMIFFTPKNSA